MFFFCIFRARVKSADNNAYLLDDDSVVNGHLTKRICPEGVESLLSQVSPVLFRFSVN